MFVGGDAGGAGGDGGGVGCGGGRRTSRACSSPCFLVDMVVLSTRGAVLMLALPLLLFSVFLSHHHCSHQLPMASFWLQAADVQQRILSFTQVADFRAWYGACSCTRPSEIWEFPNVRTPVWGHLQLARYCCTGTSNARFQSAHIGGWLALGWI